MYILIVSEDFDEQKEKRSSTRKNASSNERRLFRDTSQGYEAFTEAARPRKVKTRKMSAEYNPPLDIGIKTAVEILNKEGIETYESCEGGRGHSYPEPTIRFHGEREEGFRAFAVAFQNGLPVSAIRRVWTIVDGEPTGPDWEIVFAKKLDYLR